MQVKTTAGKMTVEEVVNPDDKEFYDRSYVIHIECGFIGPTVLVYADCIGDAIDEVIDWGEFNHLFTLDNEQLEELESDGLTDYVVSYGGNYSIPYNSEKVQAWEV